MCAIVTFRLLPKIASLCLVFREHVAWVSSHHVCFHLKTLTRSRKTDSFHLHACGALLVLPLHPATWLAFFRLPPVPRQPKAFFLKPRIVTMSPHSVMGGRPRKAIFLRRPVRRR